MKYTFTRKQIVNAFNNKILDDDNFLTYILSTTSKDRPMNQKSLDKKKVKDVSKCCNCNVNVSNGKEGTNYYIYDKCKQPCDVIGKTKELDWDNFVKSYNTNFGKDANGIKYEFYEDDLINFIQSLLQKQRTELLEEIKDLQTYVLFNDTEKLISLEQVINLLNKKDE